MKLHEFMQQPCTRKILSESIIPSLGRIQHAEDIVFWEGSYGARRAVQAINDISKGALGTVSLKWDGSPAVILGRDENGDFVFTDKSGFNAAKYDGKVKSPEHMKKMLFTRGKNNRRKDPVYRNFVKNMMQAFVLFERAVPKNFRGFVKGDMLYFNTPELINGSYVFTPNVVTYSVDANSTLGNRIAASEMGIVLHRSVDSQGNELPLNVDIKNVITGTQILVVPPVHPQQGPEVNNEKINRLMTFINRYAADIDDLLNPGKLRENKISDLSKVFYSYVNNKVDTGLENLGMDFLDWLKTSNLSNAKKIRIPEYLSENRVGFEALWKVVKAIMILKNNVITQMDAQQLPVKQSINGEPGGEGYVIAHAGGDIKLVSRDFFSKANRAVQR